MTTNKPGIKIYEPSEKGVTAMRKASFRNTGLNRYVRLADYEALQAECEKLRKDAERYRFARAYENDCFMLNTLQVASMEDLDSAIDDAMQGDKS